MWTNNSGRNSLINYSSRPVAMTIKRTVFQINLYTITKTTTTTTTTTTKTTTTLKLINLKTSQDLYG